MTEQKSHISRNVRRIKFRAWNPEKEDMIMSNRGNYVVEFDGGVSFIDWSSPGFYPLPNLIVMQFTGLKDKNGKEIYEGDIVNISDAVGKVVFVEELAGFDFITNKDIDYWNKDWQERPLQTEVIGNIYENPEMLESTVLTGSTEEKKI